MKQDLFEGMSLTQKEREDNLNAMSVGSEYHSYLEHYEAHELEEMKARHLEVSKEIAINEEELANISTPYKEAIKSLTKENGTLIHNIIKGGVEVNSNVYLIDEGDMMSMYNKQGKLVGSRPKRQSEKLQLHINSKSA